MTSPIPHSHPIRATLKKIADRPIRPAPPWLPHALAIVDSIQVGKDIYTYSDFASASGMKEVDKNLIAATSFLSGCHGAIFDLRLVLKDHDGRRFLLDHDQCNGLISDNWLLHPETHQPIQEPTACTYMEYHLRKDIDEDEL